MIRKLALTLVTLALVLVAVGCTCSPTARVAAGEIEDSHELIVPEYVAYVKADPKLDAAAKDRRVKLAESLDRLTGKLKKALED